MTETGLAIIAVLATTTAFAAWHALRSRARRRHRNVFTRWPIRTVALDEVDRVFTQTELGPGHDTEVAFVGRGAGVPGGTSDAEAWILAVLAKRARAMFEIGTCTGKTTYLWARNAFAGAEITTLTLAPHQHAEYANEAGDSKRAAKYAISESAFDRFYYSGTDVAPRITQLYGDSKQFDESAYVDRYDLIFIDGSHAYSYVRSDTEKALRMCRPGGLILWHDYAGRQHASGVYRALNELARRLPLVHVAGTTFVAYRKPSD